MFRKQQASINKEFYIQRHHNGIKLVRENAVKKTMSSMYRVDDIFHKLPLRCDFMNTENIILAESDHSLLFNQKMGIDSFIGLTVLDVSDKSSALLTFKNNMNVMQEQRNLVFEENPIVQDQSYHFVCFKLPWYNQDNNINGIFACSIPIGYQSFAETLPIISNLGFLHAYSELDETAYQPILQGRFINKIYFTKRQAQCLYHIVRGQPAKRIAAILGLSTRTIENYIESIKCKVGATSKYDLIQKFIDYI